MAEAEANPESLLSRAKEQEKEYDWLGAAATYSNSLGSVSRSDLLRIGIIEEALAHASYRASFQSENIEDFRTRLHKALGDFQKASDSLGESREPKAGPYLTRCRAMMAFIRFWMSEKGSDKKISVNESWRLAKESMSAFETLGDYAEFTTTFNMLYLSSVFIPQFEDDSTGFERSRSEALSFGEQAAYHLPEHGNEEQLASTHTIVGFTLEKTAVFALESANQKKDARQKAAAHWQKAVRLSNECATIELAMLGLCVGNIIPFGMKPEELLDLLDRSLELCRQSKDRCKTGSAFLGLAFLTEWQLNTLEDSEELNTRAAEVVHYAMEANRNFAVLSPPSSILSGWFIDPQGEIANVIMEAETDLLKKRTLAKKALESSALMKDGEKLGSPTSIMYARVSRAWALTELAKTENVPELRKRILEEAIEEWNLSVQDINRLAPFCAFNRGVWLDALSQAQCELANLIDDESRKIDTLARAVKNRKDSIALVKKDISASLVLNPGDYGALGLYQRDHGIWLMRLYELSRDRRQLEQAAIAFEETVMSFQTAGMPSRVAECYWQAAQVYDMLEEHVKASERFTQASENYMMAIKRIPRLKEFYEDHARYMQAWSDIEKARHYHAKQDPASSGPCWESAARIHQSTNRWSYLSPNYSAWAEVENAEDLSRNERSEEALHCFEKAAGLFRTAHSSIKGQLGKIEDGSDRAMATKLMEAASLREDYCRARMLLEEAKLLDKSGDECAASERFGKAAEMLQKMADVLGTEREKREFQLIVVLSRAWQNMTGAEAEASPELYAEASRLFDQAKDLSSGVKSRLMAQAHSRFCKALEAGTRFADTGELALHETAVQSLNSAANYYSKAGLEHASEYAKASKLLFDGYAYTGKASKEEDQEKKAKFYTLAEKILQASASSYDKADQPGKKDQVLKLLAKVQQDRELAISLTEILRAPDIVSTTMAFSPPTPTRETAVGLEKFEHAEVQATLMVRPNELHVGQELSLEIELVNAGRGAAQLTKVNDAVPKGFEVVTAPEKYRIEDSYLNLRGRRLAALRTEDVKIVLKPTAKGHFVLKPRIMYLDESGKHKSFEPDPVAITVKELGISGWLRGP